METDSIQPLGDVPWGLLDTTDIFLLIILLLLLIISALISASEVSFFSLTPSQLKELKAEGYEKTYALYKKPDKLLATILIANNFVNVGIVIMSTWFVYSLFDFSNAPILAFIIQVVVVTFIILLFGEIIPKLYANRNQTKVCVFMTTPLYLLNYILWPISYLLINSTSIISKRVTKKKQYFYRPTI